MVARRKAVPAAAPAIANPHRGEHQLSLGGREYLLRPSFSAQVAIEEKTGQSLTQLIRAGNAGALPLKVAGTIAAELIRAGADKGDAFTQHVSAEKIAELIFEEGQPVCVAVLTLCMADMATGGRTSSGEAKAVAPMTTDETTAA